MLNMKLSSLILPENICIKKQFSTKAEIIEGLINQIFRTPRPTLSKTAVQDAVFQRESLGGTAFKTGVATPHARLDGFDDLVVAICVPTSPVKDGDFSLRMVVLMLTSKTGSSIYLNTLAAFLKISQDQELFDNLCKSTTPQELIGIIKSSNLEVKKELTVQSVMSPTFPFLFPENTVKDAADMFYKNKTSYLPVIDQAGNFTGELTVLDLFRIGIPDYAAKIGNLNFLRSFEPFDELLKKEDVLPVKDVMQKPVLMITEETSIFETILKFTQSNRRHIPVVNRGKIVGIVSYMNILHKVLRA
jgi:PTS system nitrogen regulatory IIA component